MKRLVASLALVLCFTLQLQAAFIWGTDASGELTGSRSVDNGIVAVGDWSYDFGISWDVEAVDDGWVYSYGINDAQKDISHLNLEVTHDYPEPLVGHNGQFLLPTWLFADNPGNPGQPADIFGVKFDHGADFISFFSDRAPVYGNFYAKSGTGTYAFNAGMLNLPDLDKYDFIVRPDGGAIPTPEPATMAMMGLGLGALALRRRRRNK
jgi:hypothetical protein